MARPITKIRCKRCKRIVDAIIVKTYSLQDEKYPDQTNHFEKLIIKDHRKSFWKSTHCNASGKRITIQIGVSDGQNPS